MRRIALPLAGLLAVAGAFGLWLGLSTAPPSESEIIDAQAARYVAETGGDLVDCYAVPSGVDGVRLIVICEPDGGDAWYAATDARGRVVEDVAVPEDGT
ncbi:hypothetical protein [Gymnodinialimonas ulvae]|uniref:hypothetical protein n=1 Tax=Gymnodinialimonas ulvae TaxID=3126504 RepID=UPI0030EC8763